MPNPTDKEMIQAVERLTRHLARKVAALDRRTTGLDQYMSSLLREAQQRLRRVERLLGH